MPKPLFLHRPAGLYVRFRVPADLLGVVGSRFLVRPLKMVKGDHARGLCWKNLAAGPSGMY
jgi:hypothetical protein